MAGIHHLPNDILFEIFARLPTKPLLQSRCVSKHWNRLIADYFTKSRSRRMILLPFKKPLQAIDDTLHSIFKLPSSCDLKNQKSQHPPIIMVGAFKGIVLLVCEDTILYLYNPLTGAFNIVPNPPSKSSYTSRKSYGFGYGTTPDDLKIVILTPSNNIYYDDSRYCDVFNLKNGSWSTKSLSLNRASYIKDYAGTFVNGFLYWNAVTDNGWLSLIVSFNVKEMVFSEIQLPLLNRLKTLGTSGGRLHTFGFSYAKFELWVMNEHGKEKSWSKVLISNVFNEFDIPLSIIDEGKIVGWKNRKGKQIIIYDWLKDSYEVYEVNMDLRGLWRLQAMGYTESLISPSDLCFSLV